MRRVTLRLVAQLTVNGLERALRTIQIWTAPSEAARPSTASCDTLSSSQTSAASLALDRDPQGCALASRCPVYSPCTCSLPACTLHWCGAPPNVTFNEDRALCGASLVGESAGYSVRINRESFLSGRSAEGPRSTSFALVLFPSRASFAFSSPTRYALPAARLPRELSRLPRSVRRAAACPLVAAPDHRARTCSRD
ncbi:hypothetical protein BJY59DRAFT_457089 [Rhodotorula toruloides]